MLVNRLRCGISVSLSEPYSVSSQSISYLVHMHHSINAFMS